MGPDTREMLQRGGEAGDLEPPDAEAVVAVERRRRRTRLDPARLIPTAICEPDADV